MQRFLDINMNIFKPRCEKKNLSSSNNDVGKAFYFCLDSLLDPCCSEFWKLCWNVLFSVFLTMQSSVSDSNRNLTQFHLNFDLTNEFKVKEVRSHYSLAEGPCWAETVLPYEDEPISNGERVRLLVFFQFVKLPGSPKTISCLVCSWDFLTQRKQMLTELLRFAFPEGSTSIVSWYRDG